MKGSYNVEVKRELSKLHDELKEQADLVLEMVKKEDILHWSFPERARFKRNRVNLSKDMLQVEKQLQKIMTCVLDERFACDNCGLCANADEER